MGSDDSARQLHRAHAALEFCAQTQNLLRIQNINKMRQGYIFWWKYIFSTYSQFLVTFTNTAQIFFPAAGPAYHVLHPAKGITICRFLLNYQTFKSRERIFSQKNLAAWFNIGHLWVETNKNMNDL